MKQRFIFNSIGKGTIASLLAGFVVLVNVMTACPALHELIHHDADEPGHECAVTLFAHGQVDSVAVEVSSVTPAVWVETSLPVVISIFAPFIFLLPDGRAPPLFPAVS